jgi:hypothetical protein
MTETTARVQESLDDLPWALERVTRLCASAYVDASIYRAKLLKGFGYPNETFRAAQDARALTIVLTALEATEARAAALAQERDALQLAHEQAEAEVSRYEAREDGLRATLAQVTAERDAYKREHNGLIEAAFNADAKVLTQLSAAEEKVRALEAALKEKP